MAGHYHGCLRRRWIRRDPHTIDARRRDRISTTFLTNRVHREWGRAVDRALKLDELMANARRDGKALDADWFDEQRAVLEESLYDRLAILALGMNAILAIGVVGLAIAFGVDAKTEWGTAQGWGLIAFATAAMLVLLVARRILSACAETCGSGWERRQWAKSRAERSFKKLTSGVRVDARALETARSAAAAAVGTSWGLYGPACEWLARVELSSLARPTEPDHLLNAGKWRDRALAAGPQTAAMFALRAFVYEEFGKDELASEEHDQATATFEQASAAWPEALELYSRGAERELRPDETDVLDARARGRIMGHEGGLYGSTFRPRRRWCFARPAPPAADGEPGWLVRRRPRRPRWTGGQVPRRVVWVRAVLLPGPRRHDRSRRAGRDRGGADSGDWHPVRRTAALTWRTLVRT